MAVMTSSSWGIAFGPKMFSGGISNVTRQYDGKRRSSRICSVVNVLSVLFIVCTHDLFVEVATRSRENQGGCRRRLPCFRLRIAHAVRQEPAALRDFDPANVRF